MKDKDVEKWVSRQVVGLGRRLSTTFGLLVGALIRCRRLGVVTLGLALRGPTAPKHRIKRVDRFLGNRGVDLARQFEALGALFWGSRRRVLLALDWTELPGGFPALVLSVIVRGRAVPVAWEVVKQWRLRKSRNAIEQALLLLVESGWPSDVERIVVADRGFGYTELARFLQTHGWGYVLRVNPKVHVRDRRGHDALYAAYGADSRVRYRRRVQYRSKGQAAEVDLVWTHQPRQKEAWHLITNLLDTVTPRQVVQWYGRRMRIEESFRDGKNERWGFGMKEARLRLARHWKHLILIWAWTMVLLVLLGGWARSQGLDCGLTSTNKKRLRGHHTLSDVTIALRLYPDVSVAISRLIRELRQSVLWG